MKKILVSKWNESKRVFSGGFDYRMFSYAQHQFQDLIYLQRPGNKFKSSDCFCHVLPYHNLDPDIPRPEVHRLDIRSFIRIDFPPSSKIAFPLTGITISPPSPTTRKTSFLKNNALSGKLKISHLILSGLPLFIHLQLLVTQYQLSKDHSTVRFLKSSFSRPKSNQSSTSLSAQLLSSKGSL